MQRTSLIKTIAAAIALGAAGIAAAQGFPRAGELEHSWRLSRGPEWDPAAAEGRCRLRVFVDDRATVNLRGDQIIVHTRTGRRSYDQGSYCNQPLPFHRIENFRVTSEQGRGHITDVRAPQRANDFTGSIAIADPAPAGETYVIDVAWNNPADLPARPLAAADPYPWFDDTRACQGRVRGDFLARNREDAYLEFIGLPVREGLAPDRERISGEAWARNRAESRPLRYECMVNSRANRVVASTYELRTGRTALR
jgi:hypothetical protein